MANSTKRMRSSNYSADEKDMILSFVTENASLLESKVADPNIFKKKKKMWEALSDKMRSAGYDRTPSKLRDNYFRLKQTAKSRISKFRKEQRKTGGGGGPSVDDGPSETDWAIYSVCPTDFEEDISVFDSDYGESQKIPSLKPPSIVPSIPSPCAPINSSIIGLIDPVTGEIDVINEQDTTPVTNPGTQSNLSARPETLNKYRKKRQMTAYEEEMLKLQKKHIEARIENEKLINEKEIEILEIKKEAEKIRLEILKAYLHDKKSKIDLGTI